MRSIRKTVLTLTALVALGTTLLAADRYTNVTFDWFEYSGRDNNPTPAPGAFRNPILAGFYPDPSICRVGDDFYLINSSFSWWPGIPVFRSRDLVNWTQIGHVITRLSQADFAGLSVSRGVFAPTIRYHQGIFYVVTTLVDRGGNCFFTAKNPAGPWSDPVWLPEVDGIDPSFFFDDDGRAWLVNNGPPPDNKPLYDGHRAIWLQEFDPVTQKLTGPRAIVVNGGADLSKKPIWIEGPHLYKRGGWYYLSCAEGGTGEDHSQVIFRSHDIRGPYQPWSENPILTQRDLPADRADPVTCTGHADFVELADGSWWSVFLGCQPYADKLYNTGRQTFLLPLHWTEDAWPRVLAQGRPVPLVTDKPKLPPYSTIPLTGSFVVRDEFDKPTLSPQWNSLRQPSDAWCSLTVQPGSLTLQARPVALTSTDAPSVLVRRQQHARCMATTSLIPPTTERVAAGLVALQNEAYHFFIGVRRRKEELEIFLERTAARENNGKTKIVATARVALTAHVQLRIEADDGRYSFAYATQTGEWQTLSNSQDGTILSTHVAGGFVGTMIGLYARAEH
jgi:alpha-N-arabinofuranosidase